MIWMILNRVELTWDCLKVTNTVSHWKRTQSFKLISLLFSMINGALRNLVQFSNKLSSFWPLVLANLRFIACTNITSLLSNFLIWCHSSVLLSNKVNNVFLVFVRKHWWWTVSIEIWEVVVVLVRLRNGFNWLYLVKKIFLSQT
jgi:hypothetical protein